MIAPLAIQVNSWTGPN